MLLLIVIFLGCISILTVYRFLSVNIFLFDLIKVEFLRIIIKILYIFIMNIEIVYVEYC